MHEGQEFCFCEGGGVDGSGKSLTVAVGVVFRRGGGRLFRSGLFYGGRCHVCVGWGFCGGGGGDGTGDGVCREAGLVLFE